MTPPIVLVGGGFESVRGPGRRGIPIYAGTRDWRVPLRSSNYVTAIPAPPSIWSEKFTGWLESVLRDLPGAVVVPLNDDVAWRLSRYVELKDPGSRHFAVGSFASVKIANLKGRLAEACGIGGVPTPATVVLSDDASLEEAAGRLSFPLAVKPQTRVGMQHWTRGRVVRNPRELAEAAAWFRCEVRYREALLEDAPDAAFPIAQEFIRRPGHEVYHIAGYLAASGSSAVKAHRKLLQVPLRFGSGVLFETAPVNEVAAAGLLRLLAQIGYHGMFEAEFLEQNGEPLLIDLNVRPYNGMSLELAQGLDLMSLAWLEASGQCEQLEAELAAARAAPLREVVWADQAVLASLMAGQLLSGGMTPREAGGHLAWLWRHRSHTVSHYFSRDDLRPGFMHLLRHARSAVNRPREFAGHYLSRGLAR